MSTEPTTQTRHINDLTRSEKAILFAAKWALALTAGTLCATAKVAQAVSEALDEADEHPSEGGIDGEAEDLQCEMEIQALRLLYHTRQEVTHGRN